jgi:Protein of unknown function (DUF3365)
MHVNLAQLFNLGGIRFMVFTKPALFLASVLICIGAGPSIAADGNGEIGQLKVAADAAIARMGESLRQQLLAAMKDGGPVAALGVCKTVAPSIAAEQSEATGLSLGRTALKVRNPANSPDDFERSVLEKFVAEAAAGADVGDLSHAEIVKVSEGRVFRYMKAIPTGKLCLKCHGGSIADDVKAEIDRLYPGDTATGFKQGELRGAFSVSKKL